jgi:hypothetical protein
MTKQEVEAMIDSIGESLPERLTGNEENTIIISRIPALIRTERAAIVELLREWIGIRIPDSQRSGDGKHEGSMWLALDIARHYGLTEVRPDIEALIGDVRAGKTYLPYYADMISKFLRDLYKSNQLRDGT